MPIDTQRLQAVFLDATNITDLAERAKFLDGACAGDSAFRSRVEALLLAHDNPDSLLDHPAYSPGDHASTRVFSPDTNNANTVTSDGSVETLDDEIPLGFLAPATRPDSLGRIGHYEVLEVLGHGGFGIVFRAFDEVLHRVVAVKVLAPQLAATSPARKRFLREARTSAQVRHENVVQVYEVGEDPLPYIAMEFIPGETLQQRLDRIGPVESAEVVRIGRQVAEGLAAAHAQDLIHRDIKPGNILIESGQQKVKITDFGLARAADDASISQSGIIAGTPMYMAPEQAKGEKLDQRGDLFSLGSVLYQMAAGRPPFRANSTVAVLKRVVEDIPRDIREIIPETPQWLCDIIAKLHAKNPDDRFQSAREVADLLGDCEAQLKENAKLKDFSRIPKGMSHAETMSGRWRWVASVGLIAILVTGLIAAVVSFIPTYEPGTVTIRTNDPELVLSLDGRLVNVYVGGIPVDINYSHERSAQFGVNPGEHRVMAMKEGRLVREDVFTIRSGESRVFDFMTARPPKNTSATTPQTPTVQQEPLQPTFTNSIGMEFVKVPKGKSWLGGGKDKPGDKEVDIKEDFYLGKYEVTQEEWEKVMSENRGHFTRIGAGSETIKDFSDMELKRFPAEGMTWDDCQLFIQRLNEKEKSKDWIYRLPTEAEWEYACRGGPIIQAETAFDYYFAKPGNQLTFDQANYSPVEGNGLKRACKVGSYSSNILGLLDMHGNVWEWCNDSIKGEDGTIQRIVRGGGWENNADGCRATSRFILPSWFRNAYVGLRLVRLPSPRSSTKPVVVAPFTDADVKRIAALSAAEQVEEVRKELMLRNPGFDGKVERKIEGGVVTEFHVLTDKVKDVSPLRPLTGLVHLDLRGTYPNKGVLADLSPLKGMRFSQLDCSSTQIADLTPLVGMPLKILDVNHNPVSDLTPLKEMPLERLGIAETKVTDLTPLKGLKLKNLGAQLLAVTDLSPLEGMPLNGLDLYRCTGVTTLDDLKGLPLEGLNLHDVPVSDLGPLKGMTTLRSLHLLGTKVTDLAPLAGLKLTDLIVHERAIKDLAPLKGVPLTRLVIFGTSVSDLRPLEGMPLKEVRFNPKAVTKGVDILRGIKSLNTIGIDEKQSWPAAEFWERYDKGEFGNGGP